MARRVTVTTGSPGRLSLIELNSLVGDIYECVLDPTGWPGVMDRMRHSVGALATWLALHYPRQVRSVYQIEVGTNPQEQQRLRNCYVPMSPFIGIPHRVEAPDVISVDDAVDYDEFLSGRFYREWAAPQGYRDFIMAVLLREPAVMTWLGFCLPERATREQKALAEAFRPHVARALTISKLIELRTTQAADLAAAVEGLGTGVLLLDAALTIRGMNQAAERLMRENGSLRVENGRLLVGRTEAGRDLAAAVAASGESRLDRAGATVFFQNDINRCGDLLAHVMPLERPRGNVPKQAVAAVFLTNPSAPVAPTPIGAFAKRFGLTPSETRVLMGLMEGKSPRAIAAAHGVTMPTIRTHLHRLYEKTGTTGQAGIVQLMTKASRSV